MRIGMTYDLRQDYLAQGFSEEAIAEFDSVETIEAIEKTLQALGHTPERIGSIHNLVAHLANQQSWDLVFNICEGLYGRSREAQVPALLEAFQIPYTFSDPLALGVTLDKAMAKCMIKNAGLRTPDFFRVDSPPALSQLLNQPLRFPLFAKPNCEGTGKGIDPDCIVRDQAALISQCQKLLAHFQQPVLIEEYLPGREYTVGILGTDDQARALGVLEVKLRQTAEPGVYSYLNKEECEKHVEYTLVKDPAIRAEAETLALACYRVLECRDAGRVDLRTDEHGQIHFLEVNPLAGLHPHHSDLPILCTQVGISYPQLIEAIIVSASERILPGQNKAATSSNTHQSHT